jgi:signal transduction histidine kinase
VLDPTFLLIPDGRLPGRRWRPVVWVAAVGTVLTMVGWSLDEDLYDFPSGHNPFAVEGLPTGALFAAGVTLMIATLLVAGTSLVLRFRRARDVERQQLKSFALAAVFAAVVLPVSFALWFVTPVAPVLIAVALTALPIGACVAILRYRLYQVDIVINRTLVYGSVTVVLAAAFAATAVLLGTALGRGSGWATAGATLVVAVVFRPLRAGVQNAVDRRFNRARYDAVNRMTTFLQALRDGRAAPEEVEGVLRELVSDPGLELLFFLPASGQYVDARGVHVRELAYDTHQRIPIERGGQPLGMVLLDPPMPEQRDLLRRVVEAGGLAIEIARLHVELRRQLAEVEASRARIVAAANEERRRIERDLHDGAQQRLVSIGLALRHAQHELGTSSPQRASHTLDGALTEVAVAIDELRELAHGLPPAHSTPDWARRSASLPVALRCRSRSRHQGSGSTAGSRPPPTSSLARVSPTPSSTRAPARSCSAPDARRGSSSSPSQTMASAALRRSRAPA